MSAALRLFALPFSGPWLPRRVYTQHLYSCPGSRLLCCRRPCSHPWVCRRLCSHPWVCRRLCSHPWVWRFVILMFFRSINTTNLTLKNILYVIFFVLSL